MTRLSIVLHTHMPYVEGFGTWPFGEEWLWEAIATSYLPLLDVLDAHPGKVTLSMTPVLADQLAANREDQDRRDQRHPQNLQELTGNEERQHCKMKRIEPAQPQQEKPSYAETIEQSSLVVRGDDKTAQHEKEIDEEPGVAQERHAVQMAVGVEME